MKVVKYPRFEVIECDRCGTEFLPEFGDDFEYRAPVRNPSGPPNVLIRCPLCKCLCAVTITKE